MHAFLFQLFVFLSKVNASFFVEHYDADVANLRIRQHLRPNGLSFNLFADNADSFFLAVFFHKLQGNFGANFTTNFSSNLFHIHILGQLAIYFDNFVPTLNASQSTRVIRQRRNYHVIIVALTKDDTNPPKATNGSLGQISKSFLI